MLKTLQLIISGIFGFRTSLRLVDKEFSGNNRMSQITSSGRYLMWKKLGQKARVGSGDAFIICDGLVL